MSTMLEITQRNRMQQRELDRTSGRADGVVTWPRRIAGFPWGSLWSFGIDLEGKALTVHPGDVFIHWVDRASMTSSVTFDLTGSKSYVYLHRTSGGDCTIQQSASMPESAASDLKVLLYVFAQVSPTSYELERVCFSNINFAAPLR